MSPWRRLLLALALPALALLASSNGPASSEDRAQTIFRNARDYTVRIRTQIVTPFLEDEQGSFEGAGFLVDAERGWVVTNAHVVGQSPSTVRVAFADEDLRPVLTGMFRVNEPVQIWAQREQMITRTSV